jgi:hypothetical protein
MSMHFARKLFLSLAIAASAFVAGCGGGDEGASLSPQKMMAAQHAQVPLTGMSPNDAAELLLNTAETAYPHLFSPHAETQSFGPFRFRQYGSTLLGVVVTADAAYQLYGVYAVGPAFPGSSISNPTLAGTVGSLIGVTIDVGGGNTTGHTLTVSGTVTTQGITVTIPPTTLTNVPAPNTQQDFCSGLANDTTFSQITNSGIGTMTITNCSFNGTSGNISATLSISTVVPGYGTIVTDSAFSITYTYQ